MRNYRNRQNEILFIYLREIGVPFEKKFTAFSEEQIRSISKTYRDWQQTDSGYENKPEYSYCASLEEVKAKDYSLVPSKYIEFVNRDEYLDYDEKMKLLQSEFAELFHKEEASKQEVLMVFKELGYEIEL